MPAGVLSDPQRVALWLALKEVSSVGVRKVHRWTPADGLQPGAAGGPHQHAVPTLIASKREHTRRLAAGLGFCWGLGHATSLFAFGLPIVLYRSYLPKSVLELADPKWKGKLEISAKLWRWASSP